VRFFKKKKNFWIEDFVIPIISRTFAPANNKGKALAFRPFNCTIFQFFKHQWTTITRIITILSAPESASPCTLQREPEDYVHVPQPKKEEEQKDANLLEHFEWSAHH
jgi:hypothetical protein